MQVDILTLSRALKTSYRWYNLIKVILHYLSASRTQPARTQACRAYCALLQARIWSKRAKNDTYLFCRYKSRWKQFHPQVNVCGTLYDATTQQPNNAQCTVYKVYSIHAAHYIVAMVHGEPFRRQISYSFGYLRYNGIQRDCHFFGQLYKVVNDLQSILFSVHFFKLKNYIVAVQVDGDAYMQSNISITLIHSILWLIFFSLPPRHRTHFVVFTACSWNVLCWKCILLLFFIGVNVYAHRTHTHRMKEPLPRHMDNLLAWKALSGDVCMWHENWCMWHYAA